MLRRLLLPASSGRGIPGLSNTSGNAGGSGGGGSTGGNNLFANIPFIGGLL